MEFPYLRKSLELYTAVHYGEILMWFVVIQDTCLLDI